MWKLPGHTNEVTPAWWREMTARYPWIADMQGVIQDPNHHAEGDVHTHTHMVLYMLVKLAEYQALSEQDQAILFAAACMHDVEKRSTTITEPNGRISAHGHAKKGEYTARTILYTEVETPFDIREQVCALVRYHGLPIWLLERDAPEVSLAECSLRCNTHHLYILSKADMLGRICFDQDEMLERVELFKELCLEQDCYGKPKEFKSNLGRYKYLNEGGYAEFEPFDDTKARAIIMSGIPGAGKDFTIRKMKQTDPSLKDVPVISLDDMRRERKIKRRDSQGNGQVIQDAKKWAKELLAKGETFIWNATGITKEMRGAIISICMEYNAYVEIWYVETPYKALLKQNDQREHKVEEKGVSKLISRLEMPSVKECHEVVYILK